MLYVLLLVSLSVIFWCAYYKLYKAFEALSIEYGRLWNETKQLRRRFEDETL